MICLPLKGEKEESTCEGDSGGPLTVFNKYNGRAYLVGIVSVGGPCIKKPKEPRAPTKTTYVYAVMDWIQKEFSDSELMKCYPKV